MALKFFFRFFDDNATSTMCESLQLALETREIHLKIDSDTKLPRRRLSKLFVLLAIFLPVLYRELVTCKALHDDIRLNKT